MSSDNFQTNLEQVLSWIVLDRARAEGLYNLVIETSSVPGDMAECGVFRGGSAKLMAKADTADRILHIFDTFEGIPAEQRMEGEHKAGDFTSNRADVEEFLRDCPTIKIYEGLVPDTLDAIKDLTFSLVNLDMDIYVPTIAALHFFWPRLSPGGVIVLDDVSGLYGVTRAMHEFEPICGVSATSLAHEQAMFRKEVEITKQFIGDNL